MTEKLPKELKQLSRTLRPSREQSGLDAGARLSEVPDPPATLSEAAAAHWCELAPLLVDLEVLTAADVPALKLACKTLATVDALEASIEAEGFVIAAATGGFKANPSLKALESARNQAVRMLADFGLNPKAKKYVSKAPGKRSANPWARFHKAETVKHDPDYNVYDHLED